LSDIFGSRHATLRLAVGAALISASGVWVNLVQVTPTVSAVYRTLIGGVVLLAWLLVTRRRVLPTKRTALTLFAAGVLFALDLAFWHRSLIYVGPGLGTLLGNFQVFFMALAGVLLFREKLPLRTVLAVLMAMVGLVMIVGIDIGAQPRLARLGVLFGLLTAVSYAGFLLCLRRAQLLEAHRDATQHLMIVTLVCAALLLATAFAGGESLAIPTLRDGVYLVCLAVISQVVAWLLITSAIAHVPAARAGLILLLQPVLAYTWDMLFFGLRLDAVQFSGALLAVVAIYLGSRPAPESN
jgi:drug/metabolite transporter (DMT)-like permease